MENTDPIIWNFSDSVLSVPANYGYDITELGAHSAYYLGLVVSLTEVVEFDLINFRSSPADDYLSVEGVGDGHFAYDRVNGIHFGSDVLVGEAGHLMILLGDYNDGQGMSASVINGRVDLTTTQGSISAEYVERLDGFNYDDILSGDENRNLIAGVGGDDTFMA